MKKRREDPLESTIEAKVCAYARTKKFYDRKFVSPNNRSVPDRLLVSPSGQLFFIEFKRKGKQPTEGQRREINDLRDRGQKVYVVDDVDTGKALIDRLS